VKGLLELSGGKQKVIIIIIVLQAGWEGYF
jgi:hypothetical protein